MATEKAPRLEDLTKMATDFVTRQKGLWDHVAWTDFLSNVQKKGYDVSGDMQRHLGEMVEAMKRFYSAAASTESMEKAMKAVVDDSVTFVKQHKGVWGHAEWEDFVKTVRQNTQSMSEGATSYLGGVLEAIKVVYPLTAVAAVQKQVAAVASSGKPAPAAKAAVASEKKVGPKPAPAKAPAAAKAGPAAAKGVDRKDDLTAIGGIGPALAKKLNGAGITSFAQLATLTDADIERLEKDIIRFTGRIKRDDWVGQAKKLAQG